MSSLHSHKQNLKKYYSEPIYNVAGIFTDYLPVPIRWLIFIAILALITIFAGFWGLVKTILGVFWVVGIFLIVALIYQIIKDKKKK